MATLFGTGMPKAIILIKDPMEYHDVEENLKDYWEKDIKKIYVEYKVDFIVEESAILRRLKVPWLHEEMESIMLRTHLF